MIRQRVPHLRASHFCIWRFRAALPLVLVGLAVAPSAYAEDEHGGHPPLRIERAITAVERHLDAASELEDERRSLLRRRALHRHLARLERAVRSLEGEVGLGLLDRLTVVREHVGRPGAPEAERPRATPRAEDVANGRSVITTPVSAARPPAAGGVPVNDTCETAMSIGPGTVIADLTGATSGGVSSCDNLPGQVDLWFRYEVSGEESFFADSLGTGFDVVLSIFDGCLVGSTELGCAQPLFGGAAHVAQGAFAPTTYWLRVGSLDGTTGPVQLNVGEGGVIRGRVVDEATGAPIVDARVGARVVTGGGIFGFNSASTDSDGFYEIRNLESGGHGVFIQDVALPHVPELFDDLPCLFFGCDPSAGQLVELTVHETVEGIDFALARAGAVEGRVTDADGRPLQRTVELWAEDGSPLPSSFSDAQGVFRFEGLPPGTYFAFAERDSSSSAGVLFDGIPCEDFCDRTTGTPIVVTSDTTLTGIDFVLDALGRIEGRVTRASDGTPLDFVIVEAFDAEGRSVDVEVADFDGAYALRTVVVGPTYVRAQTQEPVVDEVWPDVPCPVEFGGCDVTTGSPIEVIADATVGGIDFTLEAGGMITGTVRAAEDGRVLPGARIDVWPGFVTGVPSIPTDTGPDGTFQVAGLVTADYFVTASLRDFRPQLYLGLPCPATRCNVILGTPIPVVMGQESSDVDFALERGGRIVGRVTDAITGQGVPSARVAVRDASGERRSFDFTDAAGNYEVTALEPGTYTVETQVFPRFEDQVYDGVPCPGGAENCPLARATTLVVTGNDVFGDIDFALEAPSGSCDLDATTLCLRDGRFSVDAAWRTQEDAGAGQAVALAGIDDSGTFWFFDERNVELVVKVLDGCNTSFGHFWMFAAGLTNVEVTLRVTDTLTGDAVSYFNPPGRPFEPILDTRALDTCDVSLDASTSSQPARAADAPFVELSPVAPIARTAEPTETSPDRKMGTCVPDATTLCLNESRFAVRTAWETVMGDQGEGRAVPLTDDTGFFWFFDASNIELMVKALDGCNTVFESYWIFAGGLTNVGVTMTVTDTVSGEEKVYVNPLREPFQAVLDTRAFETCMP